MTPMELARRWRYPVPAALRQRQTPISADSLEVLKVSITTHYHSGPRSKEQYSESVYQTDLAAHLTGRVESDRRIIVPWLNAIRALDGLRILEVGCGSGSSTVALAEQGAIVTGIDVETESLIVARDRCRLHGQIADIREVNATEVDQHFKPGEFDLVIIFACLEHMTIPERMQALPLLWDVLRDDGLLAIIETPNRLWFYDHHTALMPFFNWLPDDLAFAYSRFSDRKPFKDRYRQMTPSDMHEFLRQGRGVSYHELDSTLGSYRVVSSLSTFHGYRHTLRRSLRERRYKALIKSIRPDLHDGWFEPWLDLVIAKQ
jgi:2-polyprenyl-3-methyl-5-hydroxy-6-metoxy-1,4-benzoquinol methylase